jgi:membrane protease YdiL (CAAX protease family)
MQQTTFRRSYPHDTWKWIWPDLFIRLIPFWIVAGIVSYILGGSASVGLVAPPQGWIPAILIGILVGLPMLAAAIFWRWKTASHYRLPTRSDQALQTFFYLILNAPTEEVFWRGVIQMLTIKGFLLLGMGVEWSSLLGIGIVSIIFGAYHRLGGYKWKFNIAAMAAGAVFGSLYVFLPGPSIVTASIVHGLTTAGYLSWGDVAIHRYHIHQARRNTKELVKISD